MLSKLGWTDTCWFRVVVRLVVDTSERGNFGLLAKASLVRPEGSLRLASREASRPLEARMSLGRGEKLRWCGEAISWEFMEKRKGRESDLQTQLPIIGTHVRFVSMVTEWRAPGPTFANMYNSISRILIERPTLRKCSCAWGGIRKAHRYTLLGWDYSTVWRLLQEIWPVFLDRRSGPLETCQVFEPRQGP